MRTKWPLVGACLVLPITTIADQLNIRPGLWEITSTTHTSGMPPLPKSMTDKMTPAQRAEMEASMKADAAKGPRTETERDCITQKDIENPFDSETEGCTHTIVTTTRTTQELRLTCTGDVKGSGVMRITTPTPESMTGVMDLKMGTAPNEMTMKAQYKGRWLGTDCGDEGENDDEEETAGQSDE